MTRKSTIRCSDIDSLLDLETIDSRPDRASLAKHLRECQTCRERAPELAWLYGHLDVVAAKEVGFRRQRLLRATAYAAVLVVTVTAFSLINRAGDSPGVRTHLSAPVLPEFSPTRILPSHLSKVEIRTTSFLPEQAISTTSADGVSSLGAKLSKRASTMEWIR